MILRYNLKTNKKMNLEDLRNALFTFLIANHDNGEFLVNEEDLNKEKYNLEITEFNYHVLSYMGIDNNATFLKDSEKENIYKTYADKLIKKNKAYYCFCTKEELNRKRMEKVSSKLSYKYDGTCKNFPKDEARRKILLHEDYTIRYKIEDIPQTTFKDLVYGDITCQNKDMEDEIIIKTNHLPNYHFLNVVNDIEMNISHITNSIKYINSAFKTLLIYEDFNLPMPTFIHYPILNSKEDTLEDLLDQGFLKEAIINYLAFVGFSPKSDKEFLSLEELISLFDIKYIKKRTAKFDLKKLLWFNRHYIKNMTDEDYIEYTKEALNSYYDLSNKTEEWLNKLLLCFKNRLSFKKEIVLLTRLFFKEDLELDTEIYEYLREKEIYKIVLDNFKKEMENVSAWNEEVIKCCLDNLVSSLNLEKKDVFMPIRAFLTNSFKGISLEQIIYLLGKDVILKRLNEAL